MFEPSSPQILVVDDEEVHRHWMRHILEKAGYAVSTVMTGAAGLELAAETPFDLILLDVGLPDHSGYEICRRLKREPSVSPPLVLMISASYIRSEDQQEGLAGGADGYLVFPLAPRDLLAHVRMLLRLREAEHRARLATLRAELGSALAGDSELTKPLQQVAGLLVRHLDAGQAWIWGLDAEDWFTLQASAGCLSGKDAAQQRLSRTTLMPVETDWLPYLCDRMDTDPTLPPTFAAPPAGLRAFAGYPLHASGRLRGYAALLCRKPLLASERELLESLAEELGRKLERTEAELRLRRSEERYCELFATANDIIYSHDLQGRFITWNPKGEQLTGYSRDEMLRMGVDELIAPDHLATAREMTRRKVAGESGPTTYEVEVVARDGSRVPLEVSSHLLYQDGRVIGVSGLARDIRERKSLQSQLLQAQKLEAVGRLAGGVAHDFNNMLAVINGYSELLLSSVGPGPVREGLSEIRQAGERATSLTRQLLAFSRKQLLEARVFALGDLVAEIERLLRRSIGEDIELRAELAPDAGHIKADAGQIEQVVLNMALNARDAMPTGGRLTLSVNPVEISPSGHGREAEPPPGRYVELTVRDTGIGMPPDVLERIWEPFFTTRPAGQGSGLGLSTVYGIVHQSGGYIFADSRIGEGSLFRLYLPRVDEHDSRAGLGMEAKPRLSEDGVG